MTPLALAPSVAGDSLAHLVVLKVHRRGANLAEDDMRSRKQQNPVDYGRAYDQLCQTYRGIDDVRLRLLGLLPLATGGLFALVNTTAPASTPIGVFGFVITLGLFSYEFHAMKRCGRLIHIGRHLEREHLKVSAQFQNRPHQVAGFIDEPFAASVIYPATLATWAFLAISPWRWEMATTVSLIVFGLGFIASLRLIRAVEDDYQGHCEDGPELDAEDNKYYKREPKLALVWHRAPRATHVQVSPEASV